MYQPHNAEEPSPGQDSAPNSATSTTYNAATTVQTALPLRHPIVHVSLYEPHKSRRTWWFAYRCAHCGYGHAGQLRNATDEDSAMKAVMGARRSRCGKRLWLVVARVYRGNESAVAA